MYTRIFALACMIVPLGGWTCATFGGARDAADKLAADMAVQFIESANPYANGQAERCTPAQRVGMGLRCELTSYSNERESSESNHFETVKIGLALGWLTRAAVEAYGFDGAVVNVRINHLESVVHDHQPEDAAAATACVGNYVSRVDRVRITIAGFASAKVQAGTASEIFGQVGGDANTTTSVTGRFCKRETHAMPRECGTAATTTWREWGGPNDSPIPPPPFPPSSVPDDGDH